MKIISKIKIHPFFYILMTICLFTGNIRDFIAFSAIIIFHELGHIVGAIIFKWNIEKIIVLPFGGLTIFNNKINTSLLEQIIVAILGPIFQIIFYLIITNFYVSNQIKTLNYLLLFFNLLPIYPLDGSKILYVILNIFFSFKLSNLIIIFTSFLIIIGLFIINGTNLILILALLFLIIRCLRELKEHENTFNKFLFERYMYNLTFKKIKKVKKLSNMRIWCRHIFFIDNTYITERNVLKKKFDK